MARAINRRTLLAGKIGQLSLFPLLTAYGLAYISVTAPKLFSFLVVLYRRKYARVKIYSSIYSILAESFAVRGYPTFCAALVGGFTFLRWPLRLVFGHTSGPSVANASHAASRFLAAVFSAWFSLDILNHRDIANNDGKNSKQAAQDQRYDVAKSIDLKLQIHSIPDSEVVQTSPIILAGKTIDLTLFAVTRALDSLFVNLYRQFYPAFVRNVPAFSILTIMARYAYTVIFALSSGTVMWAWFYHSDRLPQAYNKWISEAAQVDHRLIDVLRKARAGEFIYGKDTGQSHILQSMCSDYGWPLAWGDPVKTIPIPCEIVHMGTGPSCHWHAAVRFSRAFQFALMTNLPLQLLAKARNLSFSSFKRACVEAARSSAFLGAFVGLFYYGVCLSRTRLGPRIFNRETVTPMMWDSGLCVGAGCVLCGWSTLIEAQSRRMELALFVAPRALATLFPRLYDANSIWKEKAAFSLSTAVLFTLAYEDPKKVRGVLGQLIHRILR